MNVYCLWSDWNPLPSGYVSIILPLTPWRIIETRTCLYAQITRCLITFLKIYHVSDDPLAKSMPLRVVGSTSWFPATGKTGLCRGSSAIYAPRSDRSWSRNSNAENVEEEHEGCATIGSTSIFAIAEGSLTISLMN